MRVLLLVPLALLGLTACAPPVPGDPFAPVITAINSAFAMLPPPPPPLTARVASSPSRLTLSNFNYDRARVEAMITPYPDCQVRDGMVSSNFELPLNATRIIDTPPGADVCWRRLEPPLEQATSPGVPRFVPWNRAYTSGRTVDSRRPRPLLPRALVPEVGGRIAADGNELDPLPEAEVVAAANELVGLGAEIAIVVLLHGYRNPAHERAVRDIVERHGIALRLELSSEVWAQAREYERGVLTAINASIRPIVEGYVERLDRGLAERAIKTPARVARSNGGAELAETMRKRPGVALLAGPAGGVAGAAAAAAGAGWEAADLMTLDVGGTSADIGVIRGGRPVLSSEEHIADFPLLIPTIAVSSIGAGGGSILWLDPTGSLKVGPRSVGADPGPACYGTSGSRIPALTDAFLVAGLLAPGQRLGGKLPLQMQPAREALETLAGPLAMPVETVADGAIRVANALMAGEASNVLARRGVDAPRFRMVAFGGAGPLVAALLAEEIGIDAILIPPFPGGLSALGAARADLEGDLVEPVYERLGALDTAALGRVTANLQTRAEAWIAEQTASLAGTGP